MQLRAITKDQSSSMFQRSSKLITKIHHKLWFKSTNVLRCLRKLGKLMFVPLKSCRIMGMCECAIPMFLNILRHQLLLKPCSITGLMHLARLLAFEMFLTLLLLFGLFQRGPTQSLSHVNR